MKKIWLILILFCPIDGFSQDSVIVFDRPGIADSPYIVGKRKWQLECGFTITKGSEFTSIINPCIMIRKNLWKNQELRVTYNYAPQSSYIIHRFDSLIFTPIAIGFKQKIIKENKFIPETAVCINTFFPIEKLRKMKNSGIYNIELGLFFQNNLKHNFALNYNVGTLFSNEIRSVLTNYSVCLNYTINNKLACFIEQFSYLSTEHSEYSYDFGIMITPTEKHQIDLSYVANHFYSNHYGSLLIGYSILLP